MDNAEYIWKFLINEFHNPYGVAGLMGNLQCESALKPTNLQDSFNKEWNVTDEQFTSNVDNGKFNFCCSGLGAWGYGLAQWTSVGRRMALWDYKIKTGKSIGDLQMQLEFLILELKKSYNSVYETIKNAKSVREASDSVLLKFEIPYDRSEKTQEYRASVGMKFFEKYNKATNEKIVLYRVTTSKGLNIRQRPTTDSPVIGCLKAEEIFPVTEVRDNWGYVFSRGGWSCLDYAEIK